MARKKIVDRWTTPELTPTTPGRGWAGPTTSPDPTPDPTFAKEKSMTATTAKTTTPETTTKESTSMTDTAKNTTPKTTMTKEQMMNLWTALDGKLTLNRDDITTETFEMLESAPIIGTTFDSEDNIVDKSEFTVPEFNSMLETALNNEAHTFCKQRVQFKVGDVELFSVTKKARFGRKAASYHVSIKEPLAYIATGYKLAAKPATFNQKRKAAKLAKKESKMSNETDKNLFTRTKEVIVSVWDKVKDMAKWAMGHIAWAFNKSILQVEAIYQSLAIMYGGLFFYLLNGGTIYVTWFVNAPITALVFLGKWALIAMLASFCLALACRLVTVAAVAVADSMDSWLDFDMGTAST